VEAVAQVRDVVQPELAVAAGLLENVPAQGILQLPLVEIGPEQDRQDGAQSGVEQE
jgi:hypothetical protein